MRYINISDRYGGSIAVTINDYYELNPDGDFVVDGRQITENLPDGKSEIVAEAVATPDDLRNWGGSRPKQRPDDARGGARPKQRPDDARGRPRTIGTLRKGHYLVVERETIGGAIQKPELWQVLAIGGDDGNVIEFQCGNDIIVLRPADDE